MAGVLWIYGYMDYIPKWVGSTTIYSMVVSGSPKFGGIGSIFHPQTKARTISGIFPANWGLYATDPTLYRNLNKSIDSKVVSTHRTGTHPEKNL